MGNLLDQYSVMQQSEWADRKFYTVQDRRSGQVSYLIEEPAAGCREGYDHPCLPIVSEVAVEGEIRRLMGARPEGEPLEDLRSQGALAEQDILSAFLSIIDGLVSLAKLTPPLSPSYLDPACIRRDRMGRWTLDYLALAHAMEARMNAPLPLGVYPVGVLLYWLITGQTARRTRVQVTKMQQVVPPALQFIVIRCLGCSYTSLAELRADIERAGHEREFRPVVGLVARQHQQTPVPAPEPARLPADSNPGTVVAPSAAVTSPPAAVAPPTAKVMPPELPRRPATVLPQFPDTPTVPSETAEPKQYLPGWALPPRPTDGFRKYVVPPPPNRMWQAMVHWGSLGLIGVVAAAASVAVAVMADLIPPEYLPGARYVSPAVAGPDIPPGPVLGAPPGGLEPAPGPLATLPEPVALSAPAPDAESVPASATDSVPTPDADSVPMPATDSVPTPATASVSAPVAESAPAPATDSAPAPASAPPIQLGPSSPPAPGSIDDLDARTGGVPVRIFLDGRELGFAYVFLHPSNPFISLVAFNRQFSRTLFWAPVEGGGIRIYTSDGSFFTRDFNLVEGRIWLKLTPALRESLRLHLQILTDHEIHFATLR